ncbi:RecA-family ATPase [Bradyrhizobium sp. USDA 4448]
MTMSQVKRAVRRAVDPADELHPDPADDHTAREAELTSSAQATGFRQDEEDPGDIARDDRSYSPVTPKAWKGTLPTLQQWLAEGRVPDNDVTILSGDGGSGKTEIAMQLLICLAGGGGEWMGSAVESGTALFISCEDPEENIRDRVERIARQRDIDPHSLDDLHLLFPELDETWLVHADRDGRLSKAPLMTWLETWIAEHWPRLVVIDSVAAVFDGEAIARRQVRAFLAMLRKLARQYEVAILLLDHPSVRGMADGSGTANSVDWRNSVRSMLHLSPDKNDQDARTLEVKKSNRGRTGEKVSLRWTGLTFTTENETAVSPHRAAAEREIDDLFLRLLDKRNAQGRTVHAKNAKGSAPTEFASDPEAGSVKADAFRQAMERLFSAGRIKRVEAGPASRRREHIERVVE